MMLYDYISISISTSTSIGYVGTFTDNSNVVIAAFSYSIHKPLTRRMECTEVEF